MGNILKTVLKDNTEITPLFLHGGLNRKKRDELVDAFQNEKKEKILILSLKAGGTGLNLTSANNVIHYDLWWNPAVETQAADRTHRIGQTQNINVIRLIMNHTVEDKIRLLQNVKKNLFETVIEKPVLDYKKRTLSPEDFKYLFSE